MLSIIDVIRELSIKLEETNQGFPVNDRDLKEGFDRPSYFLDVDEVRSSNITSHYVMEEADLSIYYFAEDIYKGFLDLLQVKKNLQMLLDEPLSLDDEGRFHVLFKDVNISISNDDKALTCTMSTELIQEIDREQDVENMNTLDMTIAKN